MIKFSSYISLLIALFIIITGFYSVWNLDKINDIYWADEGLYLYNGRIMFEQKTDPVWSPVYSLWYFILSKFQPDPIKLYHLNFKILIVATALSLFWFLSRTNVSLFVNFSLSAMLLISYYNFTIWPKISNFTFVFILLGFSLIINIKDEQRIIFISTLLSLFLSYIRPEFLFSFFLLFAVFLVQSLLNKSFLNKSKVKLVIIFILGFLTFALLGLPYSTNRSFGAFSQHYSLVKSSEKGRYDINPWLETEKFISKDFGNSESITEALFYNPKAFLNHISKTFLNYPKEAAKIYTELLFPKSLLRLSSSARVFLLLMILLFLIYFLKVKKQLKSYLISIVQNYKANKRFYLVVVLFLLPLIMASLINYPRDHYLFIQYPLVILLLLPVINSFRINKTWIERSAILILTIVVIVNLDNTNTFFQNKKTKLEDEVRFIEQLNKGKTIKFLHRSSNLTYFLPLNFESIEFDEKITPENLSDIIFNDMIYINNRFLSSPVIKNVNFDSLINHLAKENYYIYTTPMNNTFLVKKTIN
mgnify:CR=1 FL=1